MKSCHQHHYIDAAANVERFAIDTLGVYNNVCLHIYTLTLFDCMAFGHAVMSSIRNPLTFIAMYLILWLGDLLWSRQSGP